MRQRDICKHKMQDGSLQTNAASWKLAKLIKGKNSNNNKTHWRKAVPCPKHSSRAEPARPSVSLQANPNYCSTFISNESRRSYTIKPQTLTGNTGIVVIVILFLFSELRRSATDRRCQRAQATSSHNECISHTPEPFTGRVCLETGKQSHHHAYI